MSERLLLCTDLDRTLLPNGTQLESPLARKLFSKFVAQPNVTLVYVTGRHKALVEEAIDDYQLPLPDVVISDVGTRIYDIQGGRWQVWSDWEEIIGVDWHGRSQADVHVLLNGIQALQQQESEKQSVHKLSYYVPLSIDTDVLLAEVRQCLDGNGLTSSLIWSVDELAGIGLLDVVPRQATKLHAIECLMARKHYSITETVFCGDSGNDHDVLCSRIPAVLVANATAEVRALALAEAQAAGNSTALYCAQGGFSGMNGNYSAGVLEGVAYYHSNYTTALLANGQAPHVRN